MELRKEIQFEKISIFDVNDFISVESQRQREELQKSRKQRLLPKPGPPPDIQGGQPRTPTSARKSVDKNSAEKPKQPVEAKSARKRERVSSDAVDDFLSKTPGLTSRKRAKALIKVHREIARFWDNPKNKKPVSFTMHDIIEKNLERLSPPPNRGPPLSPSMLSSPTTSKQTLLPKAPASFSVQDALKQAQTAQQINLVPPSLPSSMLSSSISAVMNAQKIQQLLQMMNQSQQNTHAPSTFDQIAGGELPGLLKAALERLQNDRR